MEGSKVCYTHVTEIERSQIYVLRQAGNGNSRKWQQRDRLNHGAGQRPVSWEVRRNTGEKGTGINRRTEKAEERAKRSGPRRFTEEVRCSPRCAISFALRNRPARVKLPMSCT
jgi:hypothetical protein